jgi:hypothetical protein
VLIAVGVDGSALNAELAKASESKVWDDEAGGKRGAHFGRC